MNEDLKNLAKHVKARRDEKDWSQIDVWNRGGPSNSKLTEIEDARPPAPARSTIKKLDIGLDWEPGSTKTVLAGGNPTPIDAPVETVTPEFDDDDSILYRRPEGLTDEKWRQLRARTRNLVEWEIEQALRERNQD